MPVFKQFMTRMGEKNLGRAIEIQKPNWVQRSSHFSKITNLNSDFTVLHILALFGIIVPTESSVC